MSESTLKNARRRAASRAVRAASLLSTLTMVALALVFTVLPGRLADAAVLSSTTNVAPATDSGGYAWVSYYRQLAGLGAVTRNAGIEGQEAQHIRYLANHALACETDVHNELTSRQGSCGANPYATAGGKAAANNSDITRVSVAVSDRHAVSNWFSAAFHALVLLDPRLTTTGYAAYYTSHPTGAKPLAWDYTAAVDVYRGRAGRYGGQSVAFPGNNASTPLLSYQVGTESPEPFQTASGPCRAWGSKSLVSAPVIVQYPLASRASLTGGSLVDLTTGTAQQTCSLTAGNYPAGSLQRQFMDGGNGITKAGFYYAAQPFVAGHRYQLRIGGAAITTFYATDLPSASAPAVAAARQTLQASWHKASPGLGSIRSYQVVVYAGSGCTGTAVKTLMTTSLSGRISGLRSGTVYWVRLAAVNSSNGARIGGCTARRAS